MSCRFRLLLAALAFGANSAANAHAIWIERDGDGPARAYFGEFAEGVREKTGANSTRSLRRSAGRAMQAAL